MSYRVRISFVVVGVLLLVAANLNVISPFVASGFQFWGSLGGTVLIAGIAEQHHKTPEQVLGWWREYAKDCRAFDQSPVEFEFLQWYAAKLAA